MPIPIVCLADTLRQCLETFRGLFSSRQWKYFVTVLLALILCEERRTLKALLRTVADRISLSGLSRFLARWPWSEEALAATWQTRFRARLAPRVQAAHARQRAAWPQRRGRPQATLVTGYLILDDSTQAKPKGRKMKSLGRHHSASAGGRVVGHSLFTGLYLLLGRRCPLAPRMYRQQEVCRREGVPFRSKIDLALETIRTFQPAPHTQTHLLIDSWYTCRKIWKAAQARGWRVSGGLKSNRKLRLLEPDGTRRWLSLAEYAATLQPQDFQPVIWPSQQGGRLIYAHLVSTWVRKVGPCQVLVTRPSPDAPLEQTRFWGTSLCEVDAQALVHILALRWEIEVLFEDFKDLLGSDHYQLLSDRAIVRFWTLVACAAAFLDEVRATQEERRGVLASRGEARRLLQRQQRKQLLVWLSRRLQRGAKLRELQALLMT